MFGLPKACLGPPPRPVCALGTSNRVGEYVCVSVGGDFDVVVGGQWAGRRRVGVGTLGEGVWVWAAAKLVHAERGERLDIALSTSLLCVRLGHYTGSIRSTEPRWRHSSVRAITHSTKRKA